MVRDGVDPSTSGFSERHSLRIDTPLIWENVEQFMFGEVCDA